MLSSRLLRPTVIRRGLLLSSRAAFLSRRNMSTLRRGVLLHELQSPNNTIQQRSFQTEADFHTVADATLEAIQDALDEVLDTHDDMEYEVTLASGVLTLKLPPHGTWVLNKQTPNRQLWWSSPLSGPQRYEYDDGAWFATQDGLSLGPKLVQEMRRVHPSLPDFVILEK